MYRFMKTLLMVIMIVAIAAPVIASQFNQKEGPGISMFTVFELNVPAQLDLLKSQSPKLILANIGINYNANTSPRLVITQRSSGSASFACYRPNGDGWLIGYKGSSIGLLHIDPGRLALS